jgi:hypothetical protein
MTTSQSMLDHGITDPLVHALMSCFTHQQWNFFNDCNQFMVNEHADLQASPRAGFMTAVIIPWGSIIQASIGPDNPITDAFMHIREE